MRFALTPLIACLALGVPVAGAAGHPRAAPRPFQPRLHWHEVISGVANSDVVASDRYVAAETSDGAGVTLLNEQTHQTEVLSVPGCQAITSPMFGGPWLAVTCIDVGSTEGGPPFLSAPVVELDDLSTRHWTSVALSAQLCDPTAGTCAVSAVGTDWIRIDHAENGCDEHCDAPPELQNINTGALAPDPPAEAVHDDLDAPSAVGHPCPGVQPALSLPYLGTASESDGASFIQLGGFVLTPSYSGPTQPASATLLRRCGSRHSLVLETAQRANAESTDTDLVASTQMIIPPAVGDSSHPPTLDGLLLPSLRRFVIPHFDGEPAAASGRTLFAFLGRDRSDLWAATVPPS